MPPLMNKYCPRTEFESYEDFCANFTIDVPPDFHFGFDVIDVYARAEPTRRALVWCDDEGREKILDFAALARLSDQTARAFLRQGVKKGDPVMLCLKGRWHYWTCLGALAKIGAIAVPATHMMQKGDLEYRFGRLPFRMILAARQASLMDNIDATLAKLGLDIPRACVDGPENGWPDFNTLVAAESDAPFERPPVGDPARTALNDTLLLYFSSGTTGLPKIIPQDHSYPLAHITTAKYWQQCEDGGLHYTVADTGWAKCVWGKMYGQWLAGAAVFAYDYERFNAAEMLEKTAQYGVTSFCAPPTIYRMMIREDLSKVDFTKLRRTVIAGEPLNPEVYYRWLEATGLKLREGYGQTETVIAIGTWPWFEPKPGSMGKPVPMYQIDLIDPDGRVCDAGEVGEIALKTPPPYETDQPLPLGVFPGYRDEPDKTRAAWHDGYYRTGDLAWRDEEGYLWFVGRDDDLIKSSGYKIGPFEVESALIQHPAVLECAITGVPDPVRGQVVKATVVLNAAYRGGHDKVAAMPEGAKAALTKELQNHVKQVTEPYKYPRVVEFVDELPKTISGKIRRVQIRQDDDHASGRFPAVK